MNLKTVDYAVLYSNNFSALVEKESVEKAIKNIKNINSSLRFICADSFDKCEFDNVSILVNTLGSYYPENNWGEILSFYEKGGIVLNVGARPFTVPYSFKNGEIKIFEETQRAIHSLHMVDEYAATGSLEDNFNVEVLNHKYSFIKDMLEKGTFPKIKESYSAYYQLAEKPNEYEHWMDRRAVQDSQIDITAAWYDEAGRRVAAPIARVDHFEKGSMMFLNFVPEANYYNSEAGIEFLSHILSGLVNGRFKFDVKLGCPRYTESETPMLNYSLEHLPTLLKEEGCYRLEGELFDIDKDKDVQRYCLDLCTVNGVNQGKLILDNLSEGFYGVRAVLYVNDKPEREVKTGFYKVSKEYINKVLDNYSVIKIDKSISTDYCTRDEKPYLMHGVNYHVTDTYRMCFIDFNPYQCHLDFEVLTSAGMNILRTGNWQCYDLFYDEEGNIRENIIRNLEAFYLTAAKHNLSAQFVLGAFIMNHWDRTKCPVHNPEMREKTINAFKSFAKHFAAWPNVQVDAINEPSYSIKGSWNLAKPSEDPYERINWIQWLKGKYNNHIEDLRDNWGVNSNQVTCFDEANLPTDHSKYQRGYDRQEEEPSGALHDFYEFAFETYSGWISDLRKAIKEVNSETLFMMGRDESLRVPAQQYEAYKDNIDIVNLHHWHKDAFIFSEYLFNKVRGIPCCGQEIGTYHFGTQRNDTRLSEIECAQILERKLLYSFGNWIQWQAYNDPYMIESIERALGLLRADKTEGPNMDVARLLAWIEESTRELHFNRDEDVSKTTIIFPTSEYFSVDSGIAYNGMMRTVKVFFERLKMQADIVLESLFVEDNKKQMGNPNLIIMPAAMCISNEAWNQMLRFAQSGKTILISGIIDMDEYWNKAHRLANIGIKAETKNIKSVEKIKIGEKQFVINFREALNYYLPAVALSKIVFDGEDENVVKEIPVGKGKLLICPMPIELSSNEEAIMELYMYAASRAEAGNRIFTLDNYFEHENMIIYPMVYKSSTVYTIVNEGYDDTISFTDVKSGQRVNICVKGQRGAKLWISPKGEFQAAYLNGNVEVGGLSICCEGSLSITKIDESLRLLAGAGVHEVVIRKDDTVKIIKVVPFKELEELFLIVCKELNN